MQDKSYLGGHSGCGRYYYYYAHNTNYKAEILRRLIRLEDHTTVSGGVWDSNPGQQGSQATLCLLVGG